MKRILLPILAILSLALFSCQKAPELTLTGPTSIDLSVDGSSSSITFTANRDWLVNSSDSWVTVSPASGTASDGTVTVTVRCNANTTYEDRTATVTIRMEDLSQSVTVRQPANLGVVLPKQVFDLQCEAKSIDVEVQANVQYTVSTSVDWIKQTGTKGLTSKILTFSIEENTTYDSREGKIAIKPQEGNAQEQVVTVRQAQKDALTVEKTSYDMPYGGGDIEIKVETNVDFDVKSDAEWVHYVETKALNNATIYLTVDENKTYSTREGRIDITQKNGSLKHTIMVAQAGRIAVSSVYLNKTTLSLVVGESETLTAIVKPDNATDKSVTWSSSDNAVATVNEAGKVTAVAEGSAVITATVGEISVTCNTTVSSFVKFEDALFKAYCIQLFDKDGDGELSIKEASDIVLVDCHNLGIKSVKGIEYFSNLNAFDCSSNPLKSIDISECANLRKLWCSFTEIEHLDVHSCSALIELKCYSNHLTELKLCPNLCFLACENNQLETIDLRGCPNLEELLCGSNPLTNLDLSNNLKLKILDVFYDKLTSLDVRHCIYLNRLQCTGNQLTTLDVSGLSYLTELVCVDNPLNTINVNGCSSLIKLYCSGNYTSLDVSSCKALQDLSCGGLLSSLDVSGLSELKKLVCSFSELANLNVTGCFSLTQLSCEHSNLSTLDLTTCNSLEKLFCNSCQLTSIDVRDCSMLKMLDCSNNQLSSIDVSCCTELYSLRCGDNLFSCIDVSKNLKLVILYCQNCPLLKEIWLKNGQSLNSFGYDEDVATVKYKD